MNRLKIAQYIALVDEKHSLLYHAIIPVTFPMRVQS